MQDPGQPVKKNEGVEVQKGHVHSTEKKERQSGTGPGYKTLTAVISSNNCGQVVRLVTLTGEDISICSPQIGCEQQTA